MKRASMVEFPDVAACDGLDRQNMRGVAVVVAPVCSEAGDVEFDLPEGRRTHLWRTHEVQRSRVPRQQHDCASMAGDVRAMTPTAP